MLGFAEAQKRFVEMAPRLGQERVGIDDASGRILAVSLASPVDLPPFDYSAMDGYAVRAAAFVGEGPWTLEVRGESRTGVPGSPLEAGFSACRIFTGAEIPLGADAVVMQEHVTRDGTRATFRARPGVGAHIRRRGEDLRRGDPALPAGTRLRPSQLALAATLDLAWLDVARRPLVTFVGTGDELRSPGTAPMPGTIPESNSVALRAMAVMAGAIPRVAPFVQDDPVATERALAEALRSTDLLVTIGGVSVGDHDLVRPALEAVGVILDFWKVAVKPGKPMAVGKRGDAVVLGLPGNPASAMITFALFGVPMLRAMQGDACPLPSFEPATLAQAISREPGRTEFLRATARRDKASLIATPLRNQSSGAVTSMAEADALVRIHAEQGALAQGDAVDLLWLRELGL
jgi:molybdopterin molybdotransferase